MGEQRVEKQTGERENGQRERERERKGGREKGFDTLTILDYVLKLYTQKQQGFVTNYYM